MECCEVLSPQESRLQEEMQGRGAKYEKGRERVFRIMKGFQMHRPKIDVERAKYFTESMKQTEGQHLTLRWAALDGWFKPKRFAPAKGAVK